MFEMESSIISFTHWFIHSLTHIYSFFFNLVTPSIHLYFSFVIVKLSLTFCATSCQDSWSFIISQNLLKLMPIELVMQSQPFHSLSLPSPPALNLSQHQGLFQWVSLCNRCPKDWNSSVSISPSNEYSGLISFRFDWSPCSPRDSQESSPASQFKGINSSAFSLLYGPTLTSTHDYWESHSFD